MPIKLLHCFGSLYLKSMKGHRNLSSTDGMAGIYKVHLMLAVLCQMLPRPEAAAEQCSGRLRPPLFDQQVAVRCQLGSAAPGVKGCLCALAGHPACIADSHGFKGSLFRTDPHYAPGNQEHLRIGKVAFCKRCTIAYGLTSPEPS